MTFKKTRAGRRVDYSHRWFPYKWSWDVWLPIWHEGRGLYVTIELWFVTVYRGY